jgi:hypothetical protein
MANLRSEAAAIVIFSAWADIDRKMRQTNSKSLARFINSFLIVVKIGVLEI